MDLVVEVHKTSKMYTTACLKFRKALESWQNLCITAFVYIVVEADLKNKNTIVINHLLSTEGMLTSV